MPTIFQLQRAGVRAFARTGAIIPSRLKSTLEPQAATTGQAGSDNFISDRSLALGVAGLAGSAMAFFSNQARQDNADTRRELSENIRATNEATRRELSENIRATNESISATNEAIRREIRETNEAIRRELREDMKTLKDDVDKRFEKIDGSLKEISASLSASQSRRWW